MKTTTLQASSGTPMLTIALPVFNGGDTLALAVESVLGQTFSDWELLILDDGSNDGAVERLHCLGDPRVFVIRDGLNKGLAARLNEAIDMARGLYFARMDHDDISHPERFFRQITFLQDHQDVDLLSTSCVTMDEHEHVIGTLPAAISHEEICRRPWLGFYMPHPSWMGHIGWFRRYKYGEPAPYCSEDQELLLRACLRSRYHTLPVNLLAYRIRAYVPWKKLLRTRLALARVQLNYFLAQRIYSDAFRSCATAVLRLARDAQRRYFPWTFSGRSQPMKQDEIREWVELISWLKVKAEMKSEGQEQ